MANRHLGVWQRSLLTTLVVAVLSFVTSLGSTVDHSIDHKTVVPVSLSRQHQVKRNRLEAQAVVVQQDVGQPVSITLAEPEKAGHHNPSVPVQFQGKTIREVKLKSQPQTAEVKALKPITQSVPAKPIALTFDDGPWSEMTSKVLQILKANQVKATFFVIGKQVEKQPQLVKQAVAEGHAIGNHTWSHQYHHFPPAAAARELDKTAALVNQLTGVKTSLFRPPAGILNNGLVAYAQQKKYAVVLWSVDSKDWRRKTTTPALINNLLKDAKPGGIVLLHDGGGDRSNTIKALPQLITQLKKHGYTFVTVPELLEMGSRE